MDIYIDLVAFAPQINLVVQELQIKALCTGVDGEILAHEIHVLAKTAEKGGELNV